MGTITAQLFISLDGVVEAPEKWHFPFLNDEMMAAVSAFFTRADTLLLGRATYETFASSWPNRPDEEFLAQRINSMPKLVASSSIDAPAWRNTSVTDVDLRTQLTRLTAETDATIAVAGSITLVRWLIQEQLLDELELMIHPIVLGHGEQLFTHGRGLESITFDLRRCTPFSTGVLDLIYQRPEPSTEPANQDIRS
ncbi:dihydrofolate reductase family protein [Agromyces italicus]|uniref:dihydrofolate reductase family protein n=1 Tax=Agromyces italicus TaxID=279572 RepID=UPI0003B677DC|nr:dihydrofolate reductase family protein [Agromyces italicus]